MLFICPIYSPALKENTWYPSLVPHNHRLPTHNYLTEKQALNIPATLPQRPGNPSRCINSHGYTCASFNVHTAFPLWEDMFWYLVFAGTISHLQNSKLLITQLKYHIRWRSCFGKVFFSSLREGTGWVKWL